MQARKTKRAYDATRRRSSAEQRRARILEAARRLFGQHGYGATSIERIAHDADVAAPTVYVMFGSKRALLFALLDQAAAQADVTRLHEDLKAAVGDPRIQLRLLVCFSCSFFAKAADIVDIARGAGSTDDDLLALWKEGESRRLRSEAPLVDAWSRAGALRNGIDAKEALDILWAMTGADHYRLFVAERKWPVARYHVWLEKTLMRLLLR